jgi:hypothetical protein
MSRENSLVSYSFVSFRRSLDVGHTRCLLGAVVVSIPKGKFRYLYALPSLPYGSKLSLNVACGVRNVMTFQGNNC